MVRKLIVPVGWPCSLEECPPGHFISLEYPDMLCFKSEYGMAPEHRNVEAFNCAGEYFHGEGLVQPVEMIVEDEEA